MKNILLLSSYLTLVSQATVTITGLGTIANRSITFGDTSKVVSAILTTTDGVVVPFTYQVTDWGTAQPEVGAPQTNVLFQGSGRFEIDSYGITNSSNYAVANAGPVTGPTIKLLFDQALSLKLGLQLGNGIRSDSTGLITTTNNPSLFSSLSDPDAQLTTASTATDFDIIGDLYGTTPSTWSATFGEYAGQRSGATEYNFQFNWDVSNDGTHKEAFQITDAVTIIPEPSSTFLMGLGILGLISRRTRRS